MNSPAEHSSLPLDKWIRSYLTSASYPLIDSVFSLHLSVSLNNQGTVVKYSSIHIVAFSKSSIMYHRGSSRPNIWLGSVSLAVVILVGQLCLQVRCYQGTSSSRRNQLNRYKTDKTVLKDSFYEDNNYLVRIRTTYNSSSSITCNAVLLEPNLVVSDVTCIKYSGIANIDAKFVQVIAGDTSDEVSYEVEQIYINKADIRDPGTELALLKLGRPIIIESECRQLMKPMMGRSIEPETSVRVVGFTKDFDLKENRTRVGGKKSSHSKYICTAPSEVNETPGTQLLKGAALVQIIDCQRYQLLGILAKTETITESVPPVKKHQDCYVAVSTMIRWFDQVKSLSSLAAKNDGASTQPSVVVVTLSDIDNGEIPNGDKVLKT